MPEPLSTEEVDRLVRYAEYMTSNGTSFSTIQSQVDYHRINGWSPALRDAIDSLMPPNSINAYRWNELTYRYLPHSVLETMRSENLDPPSTQPTTSSDPSDTARDCIIAEHLTRPTSSKAKNTYKEFIQKISSTGSSSSKGKRSSRSTKKSKKVPEQTSPGITRQDPDLLPYVTSGTTGYVTPQYISSSLNSLRYNTQASSEQTFSFLDDLLPMEPSNGTG